MIKMLFLYAIITSLSFLPKESSAQTIRLDEMLKLHETCSLQDLNRLLVDKNFNLTDSLAFGDGFKIYTFQAIGLNQENLIIRKTSQRCNHLTTAFTTPILKDHDLLFDAVKRSKYKYDKKKSKEPNLLIYRKGNHQVRILKDYDRDTKSTLYSIVIWPKVESYYR